MQHSVLRGFGRTLLTVTGIVLLIIFGTRAASQASSLTAVGNPDTKKSELPVANINQLAAVVNAGNQQSISSEMALQNNTGNYAAKVHGSKAKDNTAATIAVEKDIQKVAADTALQSEAKRLHAK